MGELYFVDLKARLVEIETRLKEYFALEKKLNDDIKKLEDATNEKLQEYSQNMNAVSDNYVEKYADYLDSSLAYGKELLQKIKNMKIYFEQHIPGGLDHFVNDNRSMSYYQEPSDNIKYLELLYNDISVKVNECTKRQNQGLFGFGKKVLGYENDKYRELSELFVTAISFGNNLEEWFERLYSQKVDEVRNKHKNHRDTVCLEADKKVKEYENNFYMEREKWLEKFERALEQILSCSYLAELEDCYERAVKQEVQLADDYAREYIPFGKLYFYFGSCKIWDKLYKLFCSKYEKYVCNDYICVCALFNIRENPAIILNSRKEIESIICKYIKASPAGEQLISVCDVEGVIQEFDSLSRFISDNREITGGRMITNIAEIQNVIENHIELMDDIIQSKLAGYRDLCDFNQKNPYQKIPRRCLCIAGFPTGFNEKMVNGLLRLLKQGYKAGIQVLLQSDSSYQMTDYGEKARALEEVSGLDINYQEMDYYWRNKKYPYIDMIMYHVEFISEKYNLLDEFQKNYQKESNKILSADMMTSDSWFNGYSGDMFRIPIGMNETGKIHYLEMGDPVANGTSHYAIIAGPTGSGKSTLLHTIIMESLLTYGPDELELYLMDFKEGTEFKIYEDRKIPQIKCIALDAMQEFGESILNRLWDILTERTELFRRASKRGTEIKNIAQYRKAGYKLPRILVIIDEFQVLFDREQNKKVAERCASKMSDFISRARVYGIHFIFATQTMHKIYEGTSSISRATLEEMHIRIGLQCQPKEMELLFGGSNLKDCISKSHSQKGSAVFLENDIVSKPLGIRVAYMEAEIQRIYLDKIEQSFTDEETSCLVFRGKSEPIFMKKEVGDTIYLGEPISIAGPVGINISKKRRNNLLVVGENQKLLDRIISLWTTEVLMMKKDDTIKSLYIFDGAKIIDEETIFLEEMRDSVKTIELVDNVFRVIPEIEKLYSIYSERKRNMASGIKLEKDKQKIFVVINNYQWIEPIVRLMENSSVSEFLLDEEETDMSALDGLLNSLKEDSQKEKNISPNKKFRTLLDNGYLCGIHVTMSCNDFSYIRNIFAGDLASFSNRVILKTVSHIAYSLINTDINIDHMKENTALFSDGMKEPYLFKPYRMEE